MPIITPADLLIYSQCPNKFKYYRQDPSPKKSSLSLEGQIISRVIKDIYLRHSISSSRWQDLMRLIEKQCKEYLFIKDPDEIYKHAKNLLSRLAQWKINIYPNYFYDGIINVPIQINIDNYAIYEDTLELVSLSEKIRLYDCSDGKITGIGLYNSPEVQFKIWGFFRASETFPAEYIRYNILPETITATKIVLDEKLIRKTEKIVKQLMRGIIEGIYYPSFGGQCSNCSYYSICSY